MPLRKYFAGLSADTFLLALASLFSDIAAEMLFPVLPEFLTKRLGVGPTVVGVIEGIAQAVQYIAPGFSGWLSDRFRRRKPIALFGFAVSAAAKPLIGLSSGWPGVLAGRSLDRLGSGIKSAPRDALVAASADEEHRGKAFGLESTGDNLGAFVGPLVTIALITWAGVGLPAIFLIAFVPGVLAALMVVFVRERPVIVAAPAKLDLQFGGFTRGYWTYLGVTALFGIGNSSNAFLILRATDLGTSLTTMILVYAFYNLVAAAASYPAGHLADRVGGKAVLLVGFVVFVVVYAGFAVTTDTVLLGGLFVLYGIYQGAFRAVGKSLALDFVPAHLRASGVGWYSATVGATGLIASVVGGVLWSQVGPPATFWLGVASAFAGSVALALLVLRARNVNISQ
jgi:MFS family permease